MEAIKAYNILAVDDESSVLESVREILKANFIRHYYDLHQLLERQDVQSFIGTDEYKKFKIERFKSDDTKVSNSDAFTLSDSKDKAVFQKEYDRSSGLYYQGRPTLDEILQKFSEYLAIL